MKNHSTLSEKARSAIGWASLDARIGTSNFLLYAIYGIVSPYLQILLRGLGYSPAVVGFLLGLYEIAGIAGPVFISRAVDGNGRYRGALALCSLLVVATTVPLVLVHNTLATALSIIAFSLGIKSLIPILDASVMTLTERTHKTGNEEMDSLPKPKYGYGLLRSMGSAGFVVMAIILQILPGFDGSPPRVFGIWIMASTVAFGLTLTFIPEIDSIPKKRREKERAARARLDPVFLLGLAVIALNRMGMSAVSSFFSLYVKEELGWDAVSGLWAFAAAVEIPFLIVSGRLIKRWGAMKIMAISSLSIAVRLIIYALFPSPAGAVAGQILHSASYGLFQPAAVAFVSYKYPPEKRAMGMALYMGIGVGMPFFFGSSTGGVIVETLGYRVLFAVFSLFAIASVVLYRLNGRVLDEVDGAQRSGGL